MSKIKLAIIVTFISCIFVCKTLVADPEDIEILKRKLTDIKIKISSQEKQFQDLKRFLSALSKELQNNEKLSNNIEKEGTELTGQISDLQQSYNEILETNKILKQQETALLEVFKERFKNVYHLTSDESKSAIFLTTLFIDSRQQKSDFDESFYIKKIFDRDITTLEVFKQLQSEISVRRSVVDILLSILRLREKNLQHHNEDLEKFIKFKSWMLKLETASKQKLVKLIKEAKSEKGEIESLIKRMTSISSEPQLAEQSRGTIGSSIRGNQLKALLSIDSLKGQFIKPIDGEVKQKFGKNNIAGFESSLNSKGIEFITELSAEPKVSMFGVVKFVGEIPGLGQTVIIEHSNNVYTLYGKLQVAEVVIGQEVIQGQTLGKVTVKEGQGQLYFEIRLNGLAVNPLRVLP